MTVEDVYVIPVVTEFETHVPIPVVTVDPTEINLADLESGRLTSIQINITNHGLVRLRADNVSLQLPIHPSLVFSTTNEELGNLHGTTIFSYCDCLLIHKTSPETSISD